MHEPCSRNPFMHWLHSWFDVCTCDVQGVFSKYSFVWKYNKHVYNSVIAWIKVKLRHLLNIYEYINFIRNTSCAITPKLATTSQLQAFWVTRSHRKQPQRPKLKNCLGENTPRPPRSSAICMIHFFSSITQNPGWNPAYS